MSENKAWIWFALVVIILTALGFLAYFSQGQPEPTKYPFTTSTQVVTEAETALLPCTGTNSDGSPWSLESRIGDLEKDEFGYYGARWTTIIDNVRHVSAYTEFAECKTTNEWDDQGRPKSGSFAWRWMMDPNNGFINKQVCNYELLPDQCPKNSDGTYVWIFQDFDQNPNYNTYMSLPLRPTTSATNPGYDPFDVSMTWSVED